MSHYLMKQFYPAQEQQEDQLRTVRLQSSLKNNPNGYLTYSPIKPNRRFRQRAAVNLHTSWSTIDTTLWNLALAGKARAARCNHCFSLSHASNQCEWAPDILPHDSNYQQSPSLKYQPVCKAWNTDIKPGCSYANCAYKHICW